MLDTVGALVVVLDTEGRIRRFNRACEQATGYQSNEVQGRLLWDFLLVPEEAAAVKAVFAELRAGQFPNRHENYWVAKDGARRRIAWSSTCIANSEGRVEFVIGTGIDVTERKQVEEALARARTDLEGMVEQRTAELRITNAQLRQEIEARRRKEMDLAEAEHRYRTVADFTYAWEYWREPDGVLLYCSPSCERITGYTALEMSANPELLDQIVHPDDRSQWQQHLRETVAEPGPKTAVFRIRDKDGRTRWVEHFCQPVIGSQDEFLGARASNLDITDRRQAEMEMECLREELARASKLTTAGQLAAALAHELNQPLGAIVCNVQAAEQYLSQAPPALSEVREILSDVAADGQRAGNIIHRLRRLHQKTAQEQTAVQLNKVIHDTVELMHSEFVFRGVSMQLHLEPALPQVVGNFVQLQQVVMNLVLNALDAMAEHEPDARRLHIATACSEPQSVRLSLRDSGTGLSAEQLSRVGEPFFTTKPMGMGMGLAISRSITEAHGGRLWAENNPDGGATFHLTLPLLADSAE